MGRVVDVIFYSEMLVIFYMFIIDPIIHVVRSHDGLLPLLAALSNRLQQRQPPPPPPPPLTHTLPPLNSAPLLATVAHFLCFVLIRVKSAAGHLF